MFERVLAALNRAGVRYIVVGGVATVLHGSTRLTADLDLALDLTADNPARAIEVLARLGLVPRLPVEAAGFADPVVRRGWIEERNLRVFSLVDPRDPLLLVDLFAENPLPFDGMWARAEEVDLGATTVRIASIPDLVAMKRIAGRAQDLVDIEALHAIARLRSGG